MQLVISAENSSASVKGPGQISLAGIVSPSVLVSPPPRLLDDFGVDWGV